MESAQRAGWNHGNAVYGIKPQELYSIRASRNAMRDFVGVSYNARGALIPYQACGLDNKKKELLVDKSSFFVGGDGGIRTHDPYVANVMLSQLSYTPIFTLQFKIIPHHLHLSSIFCENTAVFLKIQIEKGSLSTAFFIAFSSAAKRAERRLRGARRRSRAPTKDAGKCR